MRDEYNRRYGGGFETMLYPQRITEVAEERAKPSGEDGVLRLLYVGGLAPNRFLALADIGRALEALKEYSIRARLTIYSFPEDIRAHGPFLVSNPCIEIGGTAQAEDVPKLLRGADVLVHVESFDSKSSEYTRYSLSTKITQYLMSGVCCLAYGPGEGASIRYVAESGGGVAVGAKDFEQLRATLRDLLESPSKRALLGRAGRRFAIEHHDVTKLRERFRQAFVRACEARRPYLAPIAGLSGL
jgi:glycosyltransferase involved in cell wall biosynthesis